MTEYVYVLHSHVTVEDGVVIPLRAWSEFHSILFEGSLGPVAITGFREIEGVLVLTLKDAQKLPVKRTLDRCSRSTDHRGNVLPFRHRVA